MKTIKITVGICCLLTAIAFNFSHTVRNYGLATNKLHRQVLAQANTQSIESNNYFGTGTKDNNDGGNKNGGTGDEDKEKWVLGRTSKKCTYTQNITVDTILIYENGDGTETVTGETEIKQITISGYLWDCESGDEESCSKECKGPVEN